MSPAMVDLFPPATAAAVSSPHTQPKQRPLRKPRSGEIPKNLSSPLPDQIGVPNLLMEPSSDVGRGAPGFGNPSLFATLFSSSKVEKQTPASSGLSKPRLVKVRRHLTSPRVKPSHEEAAAAVTVAAPENGGDRGFNPSRTGTAVSDDNEHVEDGGMSGLREQINGWNPFSSVKGVGVSERTDGSSSASFESANTDFVFGGAGSHSDVKDSGKRPVRESNFGFTSEGNGNSDSFESVKTASTRFVFGAGMSSGPTSNVNSGNSVSGDRGTSVFADGKSRNLNPEVVTEPVMFTFGSGMKKDSNMGQRSSASFYKSLGTRLPDEMGKLNIEEPNRGDGVGKSKGADDSSKFREKKTSVFVNGEDLADSLDGGTAHKLPEEMGKLNIGRGTTSETRNEENTASQSRLFVFGSCLKKSTVSEQKLADDFDKSTVNELPNVMQKLNIRGSVKNDSFGKTECSDNNSKASGSSTFVSGSTKDVFGSFGGIDSTTGAFTPLQFSFNAKEQNYSSSVGTVPPPPTEYYVRPARDADASTSPSVGHVFQTAGNYFTFESARKGPGMSSMDPRTPRQNTPWSSKEENLVSAFSVRKGVVKDAKSKKRRGKLRGSNPVSQKAGKDYISGETSSIGNSDVESPGGYSPMDFSPCQMENVVTEEYSRETSVASDGSVPFDSLHASSVMPESISVDAREEDLVSATQSLDINEDDLKCGEPNEDDLKDHVKTTVATEPSFEEEQVSGQGHRIFTFETEKISCKVDPVYAAMETAMGSSTIIEEQANDNGKGFTSASSTGGFGESNFMFSAMPSTQSSGMASKHNHRRKYRTRVAQESCVSTLDAKVHSSFPAAKFSSHFTNSPQGDSLESVPFASQSGEENRSEANKRPESRQESISIAQEACEKWRLRGNQAYRNGHLSKAEEYYTRGLNSVPPNETSRTCIQALALCYSNRAATRMSMERMREALSDCMKAAEIDPNFLKVQLRAGNCHLVLGEIQDAFKHFKICLPSGNDVCLDRKVVLEASDGLQKAQRVAELMDRSAMLLQKKASEDATIALQLISDALLISPHSESLTKMKAEGLLMLHHYEEVIQLCDQTLDSAERNSILITGDGQFKDVDNSMKTQPSPAKFWRCNLKSKAYFYLGRLKDALDSLQEHGLVGLIEKCGSKSSQSLASFIFTVHELLRLKDDGNEAFKVGRHLEAVELYSAALAHNIESHPFAAVCFGNRAAAYQALGQITDAIADCSSAIALDANYAKAISRRATLHQLIRDYGQATSDLHKLVSLLEKEDRINQSGALGKSIGNGLNLEEARLRLAKVEEEARKGTPLDMYLILGIESSSSEADIKKAYRKAALRHHPDKAGQFLARSENDVDGLWKKVTDEVHRDADRLFKMIGEAYTVLSDPSKRLQYDAEEEIRSLRKNGSCTPRSSHDFSSSSPFERSSTRRPSRDSWRSSGSPSQRWTDSYRSTRYYY